MKKLILIALVAAAGAVWADSVVYWAAAETAAANGDTSGGGNAGAYSGYYCTVAKAAELFGGANTVDGVTAYLTDNYLAGLAALQASATSQADVPAEVSSGKAGQLTGRSYANGQYALTATYGNPLIGGEYLAMLFYANGGDYQFRVMANDPTDMLGGNAQFSDNALVSAGQAGSWTNPVPEPTSGLLVLLGLAAFALNRKGAAA